MCKVVLHLQRSDAVFTENGSQLPDKLLTNGQHGTEVIMPCALVLSLSRSPRSSEPSYRR